MAGGEIITPGPMAADDGLIEAWIDNLSQFEREGREVAITDFKFETVGVKTVALIMPKDGELDLVTVLPGDNMLRFETPKGPVDVNPNIVNEEQVKRLMATARVKRVSLQISKSRLQELKKTVKAND